VAADVDGRGVEHVGGRGRLGERRRDKVGVGL